MRIVVSGYIVRSPLGGMVWHYLQYVVGLRKLGHEVYYLEDSGDEPACFDPSRVSPGHDSGESDGREPHQYVGRDPSYGIEFASKVFDLVSVPGAWAYYDAHTSSWLGPAGTRIDPILSSADLFLNVSHSSIVRPWIEQIPLRCLVDTDPVFGQLRHLHLPAWRKRALQHNSFVSFGENIGLPNCSVPEDGLPWRPTRQPIVMDLWPKAETAPTRGFTTVMSWKSYPPAKHKGKEYGLKSDSFEPYLDLPVRSDAPLEVALEGRSEVHQLLIDQGWKVDDGLTVTAEPEAYQEYIRSSKGEFAVAKRGYVETNCGWFSERSAAYLASGRPVITQETGFSEWLKTDGGVVAFRNTEEATDALDRVSADYARHAKAAREVAEVYFRSDAVLTDLLSKATSPVDAKPLGTDSGALNDFQSDLEVLRSVIEEGESFILVDDGEWGAYGSVAGRKCLPFLEKNGLYWGRPANDEVAISELERMRRVSATNFLVITSAAFWWLEHYKAFGKHLTATTRQIHNSDRLKVYQMVGRSPSSVGT